MGSMRHDMSHDHATPVVALGRERHLKVSPSCDTTLSLYRAVALSHDPSGSPPARPPRQSGTPHSEHQAVPLVLLEAGVRDARRVQLIRLLSVMLASDVREFPKLPEVLGVSPPGHARSEPRAVVGRLHPQNVALSAAREPDRRPV